MYIWTCYDLSEKITSNVLGSASYPGFHRHQGLHSSPVHVSYHSWHLPQKHVNVTYFCKNLLQVKFRSLRELNFTWSRFLQKYATYFCKNLLQVKLSSLSHTFAKIYCKCRLALCDILCKMQLLMNLMRSDSHFIFHSHLVLVLGLWCY